MELDIYGLPNSGPMRVSRWAQQTLAKLDSDTILDSEL